MESCRPKQKVGTNLSGEDTRGIGRVSLEGLEGVEVLSGAGGARVPLVVDILLGIIIPKLVVVVSVHKLGADPGDHASVLGRNEGGSRGGGGGDNSKLHLR